jgi:hypothetical protein
VRSVNPRIFSHVCSYIGKHSGTEDSRVLAEVVRAIGLGRGELCFDALRRIEPSARDLVLELLTAKFYGAFPPHAWKDAYRLANELNARSNEDAAGPSATARDSNIERKQVRIAQDSASAREPVSATTKTGNFEAQLAPPSAQRRPFWHRARTTLLYAFQRAGFDSFNYLLAAAAATTVIGSFMLAIAFDEGVIGKRSFAPAWPLPESQEPHAQVQESVLAEVDELPEQMPQRGSNPGSVQADSLAESAPEEATVVAEVEPVTAPDVPPLPDKEKLVRESSVAIEDNKLAVAPSLTMEGTVAADSPLQENVLLNPAELPVDKASAAAVSEPQEPKPAQEKMEPAPPQRVAESRASGLQKKAPAMPPRSAEARPESAQTVTSKPPKPPRAAAQRKAKSDELAKNPSVARSVIPPASPPRIQTKVDVSPSVKASSIEQPPAQTITENPEPPPAAATVQPPNTAALVAEPSAAPVAQSESEPVAEVKAVQKRETLLEDWLGFKPRDVIGKFQLGRRTDQPSFIRQLENVEGVEGPAEN